MIELQRAGVWNEDPAYDRFDCVRPLRYVSERAVQFQLACDGGVRRIDYPCVQERTIACRLLRVANSKGLIVVMPGWGEGSSRYQAVAIFLVGCGFSVLLIDWSGQGCSRRPPVPRRVNLDREIEKFSRQSKVSRELLSGVLKHVTERRECGPKPRFYGDCPEGYIESIEDHLDDAEAAVKAGGIVCGAAPFVLAHSQGALIASLCVTKRRLDVGGLILTSPAFAIRFKFTRFLKAVFGRLASRKLPWASLPTGMMVSDFMGPDINEPVLGAKLQLFAELVEGQIIRNARAGWHQETLRAQKEFRDLLENSENRSHYLACPSYFMYGAKDDLVDTSEIIKVGNYCLRCSPRNFRLRAFDGKHEILNDSCQKLVLEEIKDWLLDRAGGEPTTPKGG